MEGKKEVILEAVDITYSYDTGRNVLNRVCLQIRRGERIALMGPNGAGKSTLFLHLNGVYRPQAGKLYCRGQEVGGRNRDKLRRQVGFVFQDPDSQIVASSVKAEVAFGPVNLKLSGEEIERRVSDALRQMELDGYRDRPPHYLSGGEKKRVSIAGVLAMEPKVLLFDEPSASLDPQNAGMLEELLEQLFRQGKTLVISTHDVDFAYRWADRILVMDRGELIADEEPAALFQREDILQKAHLKKPVLLQIYQILADKNKTLAGKRPPRSLRDFEEMIACRENGDGEKTAEGGQYV